MKKYGIWIAVAAVVAVCVCVGLGLQLGKEEPFDPVGTWKGSYEYGGNDFFVMFELKDDGTYTRVAYKNGAQNSNETGTYVLIEGGLVLYKNGSKNTAVEFTYEKGALVNNDHYFTKDN